jgi:glutamate-ammonia-ligase adenylyltransferase
MGQQFHGKASFLRSLREQGTFLDLLVDLGSYSPFLVDTLIRDPDTLDSFLDSLLVEASGARQRRERIQRSAVLGARQPLLLLNEHKALEVLRLALRDIQGHTRLPETLFALSRLAMHVLRRLLDWSSTRLLGEESLPAPGFALLAVGKLGGLEMGYASDVDLIFLCEDSSSAHTIYTDLAQDVLRQAGQHTQLGRLYRLDTRLRPEGDSGSLVSTLSGFERYLRGDRVALFELQALLKSSFLAGDRKLAHRALACVRQQLLLAGRRDLRDELRSMRQTLEDSAKGNDLKRGPGGLLDAEFLVQFLQLQFGHRHPEILSANLLRALRRLQQVDLLSEESQVRVRQNYLFLRFLDSRLQLATGTDRHVLPAEAPDLDYLARCSGFDSDQPGSELQHAVLAARDQLRNTFEQVLAIGRA